MIPESTRDTALVLGGGGAKGSYEIGVIEAPPCTRSTRWSRPTGCGPSSAWTIS